MAKTEKSPITIEGVEYFYEDLTQDQQVLFNHCVDLDRKIGSMQFNLDQLNIGKNAAFAMLKNSLVASKAIAEANAAEAQPVEPEAASTVQ